MKLQKPKRRHRDDLIDFCKRTTVTAAEIDPLLERVGSSKLSQSLPLHSLVLRPQLNMQLLTEALPWLAKKVESIPADLRAETVEAAEVLMKYQGYIEREQ